MHQQKKAQYHLLGIKRKLSTTNAVLAGNRKINYSLISYEMKSYPLIILLLLSLLSCKDDTLYAETIYEEDRAEEVIVATSVYNNLYLSVREEVGEIEGEEFGVLLKTEDFNAIDPCASVEYTLDSINHYVKQVVISYPDIDCYSFQRNKVGKLKVYLNGQLNQIGTVVTIIPEGFYVDGYKVEGQIKIINSGFDSDYKFHVYREVQDGKIWLEGQSFFTWNTVEYAEIDFFNEEVLYDLSAYVFSTNGQNYVVSTISPLKSGFRCEHFQSGEIEIKSNSFKSSINFGDGTCDNKAVLWQDGSNTELVLN